MKKIYFDNAATSWPKPEATIQAMTDFNTGTGANPGRSGHSMSVDSGRIVLETRVSLADLFKISDPLQLVFTKNATEALNIAILGLLKPGDHCITSSMEHNSVMRPLRALEKAGVELTVIKCSEKGCLDPADVHKSIKSNTKALYLTHASNVTGTLMPVAEVAEIVHSLGIIFCVDAAQTAGAVELNAENMNIDLLAFTGHKSLFGPQGTGGLFIRKGLEKILHPIMMGGTGSRSEFEEQPDFMPDMFESGTPNAIGIAGLNAGVEFINSLGTESIRKREQFLVDMFVDALGHLNGSVCYTSGNPSERTSVVSFNIEGKSPSTVSQLLDEEYGIMCRPGLHCAPSAHRTIGTFPQGTVRFSFSYFNTEEEIKAGIDALHEIIIRR